MYIHFWICTRCDDDVCVVCTYIFTCQDFTSFKLLSCYYYNCGEVLLKLTKLKMCNLAELDGRYKRVSNLNVVYFYIKYINILFSFSAVYV